MKKQNMETIFRKLHDFFKSINLTLEQDFEMTIHELKGLHGDGKKQSPLFRTDYFSFLLITAGKSNYTIDNLKFNLGKNSFYFTIPRHLKSFEIQEPIEGYMVTFTESFLKQNFHGNLFLQFPFLISESTPVMLLNEVASKEISALLEMMLLEFKSDSDFKKEVLSNLLSVLLNSFKLF
jgi:AraC family transcriptional regulator, transcriptional activator of pobA